MLMAGEGADLLAGLGIPEAQRPSSPPESRRRPSGEKATLVTP
jgi:hypothetical protein